MSFISNVSQTKSLPTRREIDEPFNFDSVGEVAFTWDPARWARHHILALLLTTQGERVMRPTYGAGLRQFIFESNDPVVVGNISAIIEQSLQAWEPSLRNVKVSVVSVDPANGTAEIRISFNIQNSPVSHTTAFTVSGQGVEL